jgi:hypothetical protein
MVLMRREHQQELSAFSHRNDDDKVLRVERREEEMEIINM